MNKDFIGAANVWAADHRPLLAYTTKLVEGGYAVAAFSSVIRAIAGIALDTAPYVHSDVDFLVARKHLAHATELLPRVTNDRDQLVHTRSTDGVHLAFAAHEVTGLAGSDEIQFVTPYTPIIGLGHRYNTAYSPEAHLHSTVIETDHGLLPVAPLPWTAGMYGILQRPKDDEEKVATILRAGDITNDPYTAAAAEVMGWDDRVLNFLELAGLAVVETCQPPRLAAA